MPRLLRPKNPPGFSAFDSASREDVGLPVRHGDRLLREDCGHLPLFQAAAAPHRDARGARALEGPPCLSMGHIDSTSHPESVTQADIPPSPPEVSVWSGGSRADFPAISDLHPAPRNSPPPKRTPRGKCLSFTDTARRNLQRALSIVSQDAPSFTMCLSCPGSWDPSRNAFAKECFLLLMKRLTASRDSRLRSIGLFWKQEIQSREAVHFHLLLWGVSVSSQAFVHSWLASQWNALVCLRCDSQGSADHLRVHLHASNFERVKDMAGYFSKYMGKDEKAVLVGDPIPGRWWGKVQGSSIPWARKVSLVDPPAPFRVICHRVVRKLRQKKANEAKHRALSRAAGLVDSDGEPLFSQFHVQCAPGRALARAALPIASNGARFGPYRFPSPLNTGKIILVGKHAPATAKRVLAYAGERFADYLETHPF